LTWPASCHSFSSLFAKMVFCFSRYFLCTSRLYSLFLRGQGALVNLRDAMPCPDSISVAVIC
jgi:hypothetical protein